MNSCLLLLVLLVMGAPHIYAQIIPSPGARINYTQVMFEYGKVKGADRYIVQLAEDTDGASFQHLLLEQIDSSTATMISGLQFGKKYLWRYAGLKGEQMPDWKGPYRFETAVDSLLSKNFLTLIVTKNDTALNSGGLIANDCTHSIIDRNGSLVWYLPKVNWHAAYVKKTFEIKPQIFDLRLTPGGTVTYLADAEPGEFDLDGNALWRAPYAGNPLEVNAESFNHDFKRLPNGHYMVLSNELWRILPDYYDTVAMKKKYPARQVINGKEYAGVEFGKVLEYDKKGNVVWSWNAESYFDKNALKPKKDSSGFNYEFRAHVNAFSVDQKNEFVYMGFRDISRVIKIDKRTCNVVNSWGDTLPSGEAKSFVPFHQQHDANVLKSGNIAVFNNNDYPGSDSFSSVIVFSQQPGKNGKIVWQFNCDFDSLDRHAGRNGGNADQLANGNFLVCMGNMNRIFEVTPDKKIVWAAVIKSAERSGDKFFHRLYRAHYISSLYPCYFTFQTGQDTVTEKALRFSVRIFNEGTDTDGYLVKAASTSGIYSRQINVAAISPGRSAAFEIKPDKFLHAGDKIMVNVSSKTNPDRVRRNLVVVIK